MPDRPDSKSPLSGCHHCGLPKLDHSQRWTDAAGWHTFAEPSRELIAERADRMGSVMTADQGA